MSMQSSTSRSSSPPFLPLPPSSPLTKSAPSICLSPSDHHDDHPEEVLRPRPRDRESILIDHTTIDYTDSYLWVDRHKESPNEDESKKLRRARRCARIPSQALISNFHSPPKSNKNKNNHNLELDLTAQGGDVVQQPQIIRSMGNDKEFQAQYQQLEIPATFHDQLPRSHSDPDLTQLFSPHLHHHHHHLLDFGFRSHSMIHIDSPIRSSHHSSRPRSPTPELATSDVTKTTNDTRPISSAYTTSSTTSPPLTIDEIETETIKRLRKREKVINELIETEISYSNDMNVARDIYLAKARAESLSQTGSPNWLLPSAQLNNTTHHRSKPNKPPPTATSRPFAAVLNFGAKRRSAALRRTSGFNSPSPCHSTPLSPSSSNSDGSSSPLPMSSRDTKIIFSNLEEIAHLAETFSKALKDAAGDEFGPIKKSESDLEDDLDGRFILMNQHDLIGSCFLEMLPKIEQVFKSYCSRYEAANDRLQDLSPTLTKYVNECQNLARGRTAAWDLPSLLIKPVQRCLKYPLLLDQILNLTPLDHPDRLQLEKAKIGMIEVAALINEEKRSREYIDEIIRPNRSLSRRKLSTKTRLSPISPTPSTELQPSNPAGIMTKTFKLRPKTPNQEVLDMHDETLSRLIKRVLDSRKSINKLPRLLLDWARKLRETSLQNHTVVESFKRLYRLDRDGEDDEHKDGMSSETRHIDSFQTHVTLPSLPSDSDIGPFKAVEKRIKIELIPLCEQLNKLYENPIKVINTQKQKIKEYNKEYHHSSNRAKELKEAITQINKQLLNELPKFEKSIQKIVDCVMLKFLKIQKDLSFDLLTLIQIYHTNRLDPSSSSTFTSSPSPSLSPHSSHRYSPHHLFTQSYYQSKIKKSNHERPTTIRPTPEEILSKIQGFEIVQNGHDQDSVNHKRPFNHDTHQLSIRSSMNGYVILENDHRHSSVVVEAVDEEGEDGLVVDDQNIGIAMTTSSPVLITNLSSTEVGGEDEIIHY